MNIIDLPAYELSEKLQKGEVTSVEAVKAYLDRIEAVDCKVRSFINVMKDYALKSAEKADKRLKGGERVTPMTGVPVAVKDIICVKGHRTTCASKILENFIPPYSATVIERLNDAGAVILGKVNMDEFGMGSSTENSRFFNTFNPWDLSRVPGGSSGGSAAAVAAREAPLALGTDTGGSIRQPASHCGITGLKPTYGSVSRYGLIAYASSLDQIGPMGRSVKDVAMLLNVLSAYDPMDSTSVDFERPDYYESLSAADVEGVRFGRPVEYFGPGLDDGVKDRLEEAQEIFESLGAEFVDVSIPALDYSLPAYYVIAPSEASSNLARYDGCRYGYRDPDDTDIVAMYRKTRREGFGDEVLRRIMIGTYALSSGYYDAYYLKAQKVRTLIKHGFDRAFEKCDFIFAPAAPTVAFKIGEKTDDPVEMYLSDVYIVAANLAGLPGLVAPCGFHNEMPVGLQLVGKHFDEAGLLKAAAAFQDVTGFHKKFAQV